jgi:hypothetical protein
MNKSIKCCFAGALTTCALFVTTTHAQSEPDPSPQEMMRELRELRAEVKDLRTQVEEQRSTTRPSPTPEELQTIRDVQQDAASRGNLSLTNAGYDPNLGFFIRTEDGRFLLHPWAFVQIRETADYRAHATATTGSNTQDGFEVPRMKLVLDGNVFSKDLTYQFIWNSSDTTGNLGLQDAWARYHFAGTPFAVEAGQIRDPVDHEQFLFATKTLTPDRSIVNNVLLNGDDIVKGAELAYGYDTNYDVGAKVAVTSGERNFGTTFSPYPTNPATWGVAARVEWKPMGDWKDYAQFSSIDDKATLLVIGAGADYTEAGSVDSLTHVLDVQYNIPNGLGLYGAYLGRYTRNDDGAPSTNGTPVTGSTLAAADTYDTTFRLMGSYLIDHRFEPFARYEYLQFDPREFAPGTDGTVNDITLGFNYYIYGQRAKFTIGATYLPNGSPVANTLGDLLTTQHGTEFLFQGQFQLIL